MLDISVTDLPPIKPTTPKFDMKRKKTKASVKLDFIKNYLRKSKSLEP
jgi:hypothetical protein